MRLAAHAVGIFAADFERLAQHRRVGEGELVALDRLARDLLEPNALDLAVGAGEIFGDEVRP